MVATGLVALTYGLAEVGSSTNNVLVHIVLPLASGVVLISAFVLRALRVERPLLDMRLYANKVFRASAVTMFCFGAALFGGMILLPLYFQIVRHQDACGTPDCCSPREGSAPPSAPGRRAGRPTGIGAGIAAATGGIITLVSTLPFVLIGSQTSYVLISIAMFISGFGLGLATTPAMTAAFRSLRPDQINDAPPQLNILMRVGGSIGTAILTVVLQSHLTHAGRSLSAQASAFASTFWWVLAFIAIAVLPTTILIAVDRQTAQQDSSHDQPHDGTRPAIVDILETG